MRPSENPENKIAERLARLGIRANDLEESFTRSGGSGGQNVNKVSTAVVLRHRPSGIWVRCEEERSQAANRLLARLRLAEKIEARRREEELARRHAREKLRRASRRPSKRAAEIRIQAKKRRAQTKRNRASPWED